MVNVLFRVSVTLALVGMAAGIVMGIRQDFSLAPAHAHLNLLGFVVLFLAALYYRVVPGAAATVLAKVHAATAIVGAIVFPTGIAGVLTYGHERFEPVVIIGALIVFSSMAQFAFIIFRTSNSAQPHPASRPQVSAVQR
jgi:hypothetical protein